MSLHVEEEQNIQLATKVVLLLLSRFGYCHHPQEFSNDSIMTETF